MLLAALALGCAQAGWSVLTPSTAGAEDSASDEATPNGNRMMLAEVASPFAPDFVEGAAAQSQATAALFAGLQLNGVRMADNPVRNGAVLTLSDGAQRAFLVGQEIAAGVTLSEVASNYVLLSYEGGERQLPMTAAPTFSFARAMMGLEPAPGAPQALAQTSASVQPAAVAAEEAGDTPFTVAAAAPAPEAASSLFPNATATGQPASARASVFTASAEAVPSVFAAPQAAPGATPDELAWLQATMASYEAGRGWRVAEPLPQAARDAGLQTGDLIVSINGSGPDQMAALRAASVGGRLDIVVARGGDQFALAIEASGRT